MMTNNARDARIQQILDYIASVDDYYRGILDYANAANHRSHSVYDRKPAGRTEHAGGGRVIGVR
jgi:hypothetical protein